MGCGLGPRRCAHQKIGISTYKGFRGGHYAEHELGKIVGYCNDASKALWLRPFYVIDCPPQLIVTSPPERRLMPK